MVKFKEYKIQELFEASSGDYDIQQCHINNNGYYVVSSGLQNCGIIGKSDVDARIFNKNTITVDMFGNVFFRDFEYKMVTHARVFSLNYLEKELNVREGLYLSSLLFFFSKLFSYSNMASWNKIKNLVIKMPITDKGDIHYSYMQERIRELEEERIRELTAYLKVSGLEDYKLTEEEQEAIDKINNKKVKFEKFTINELFEIATGRDFIIGNTEKGDIPLISHTNENNGLVAKIKKVSNRRIFDANKTIALADRGVFYATTQDKNFHIGTRVKALTFKDGDKSEEERLFITSSINKLQVLFTDYLTNATDKLPNLQIELPIFNNKIDYDFMKTYIKAIEKLVIKNVVDWRDKQISATKQIVDNV